MSILLTFKVHYWECSFQHNSFIYVWSIFISNLLKDDNRDWFLFGSFFLWNLFTPQPFSCCKTLIKKLLLKLRSSVKTICFYCLHNSDVSMTSIAAVFSNWYLCSIQFLHLWLSLLHQMLCYWKLLDIIQTQCRLCSYFVCILCVLHNSWFLEFILFCCFLCDGISW